MSPSRSPGPLLSTTALEQDRPAPWRAISILCWHRSGRAPPPPADHSAGSPCLGVCPRPTLSAGEKGPREDGGPRGSRTACSGSS